MMLWNRLQSASPSFMWDESKLLRAEWLFLSEAGLTMGAARRLTADEQGALVVTGLARNALSSMEIDGDLLDADRMQASVRRCMGLSFDTADDGDPPAEAAPASLAVDILRQRDRVPDIAMIEEWLGRLAFPGHPGSDRKTPALPVFLGEKKREELRPFLQWLKSAFYETDAASASPLLHAGLAHLWFESIHPFPAFAGVLGRAFAEKTLTRCLPGVNYIPLSLVFLKRRHEYHCAIDEACRDRDATPWLLFFAAAAVETVRQCRAMIRYIAEGRALLETLQGSIGRRQMLVVRHLLSRSPERFAEGTTRAHYAALTGAAEKLAGRELSALSSAGALRRSVRCGTVRYILNMTPPRVHSVSIQEIL